MRNVLQFSAASRRGIFDFAVTTAASPDASRNSEALSSSASTDHDCSHIFKFTPVALIVNEITVPARWFGFPLAFRMINRVASLARSVGQANAREGPASLSGPSL